MKNTKNTNTTKSKRLKLTQPIIRSRAEMEALAREIAELTLARNKQQTELDEAITALRERYEDSLGQIDKDLGEKMEVARAWAEANPSEFGKGKSLDLVHAIIGWRTGQPTLKTLSGFTWDRVLEKLDAFPLWAKYVRVKREVSKETILADRNELQPQDLKSMGVRVVQDEAFFIDPKIAELDNRKTAEAKA